MRARFRSVGLGVVVIVAAVMAEGACQKKSSDDPIDPRSEVNDLFGAAGPLVVDGAPATAPSLFGAAGAKTDGIAAPCMMEPEPGTLFPKNWLPPRFSWQASSNANVFELRIHVDGQVGDLVVYTGASSWTMPAETWSALQSAAIDAPITVELRGAFYTGSGIQDLTNVGKADVAIAPVQAPGNIVYWSIGEGRDDSRLRGLTMTDEGVIEVLTGNQMPAYGENDGQKCIGCHTATPDGKDVAVAWEKGAGGYVNDIAEIDKGSPAGPRPAYVSPAAVTTLGKGERMFTAFSPAHWKTGDRVLLTSDDPDLVWVDLEASSEDKATGVLGNTGDPNPRRLGPSWTHDGKDIVYMSGQLGPTPFLLTGPSDLYVMPYADRAGATAAAPAAPIAGASSPDTAEYYPAMSPDDAWVAFNALPDNGRLYDNPSAEIFVVPRAGGARTRLRANDPPACSGKKSPGVTNSWPKWAPAVQDAEGKKYYFVVFSSRRHPKTEKPQLYVSPVVVDAAGAVVSYPAIYLRNQESFAGWESWGNHTPAWDDFQIAPDAIVK
jgi:hypothetical protein